MKKEYRLILKEIKKYNTIVVLRHKLPDFDASGSQFGLVTWIKDNFPSKNVYAVGETHKYFSPALYPATDDISIDSLNDYLCIVVDVSNKDRVDKNEFIDKATSVLKIDHHPNVEKFAKVEYVDTTASAAAEIVSDMLLSFKMNLSDKAAYYLYSAIVGDSGRFQYSSTSSNTFRVCSYLLKQNVDIEDIYDKMYLKSVEDIRIVKYLYDNFKITEHGVAYYHVNSDSLKLLGIERQQIKAYVNLLAGYKEIKIWVQFSEDENEELYKWQVSIRSREVKINDIATKYNGGGHANAAGAKCVDMNETLKLIEDLDNLLWDNKEN